LHNHEQIGENYPYRKPIKQRLTRIVRGEANLYGKDCIMDKFALTLTILGALNWGLVGIFNFDAVAWIFGGSAAVGSRIIYTVIALAGIWCISMLFRERDRSRIEDH
jgi:uncharacterized membrane protein YuzA (DUF378 family)